MTNSAILLGGCLVVGFAMIGCRQDMPAGLLVNGTVTVDGQPVSGVIATLEPIQTTPGQNVSTIAWDGRFYFGPDSGLNGGTYRVRFSMVPEEIRNTVPIEERNHLPSKRAVIAPSFDSKSQLKWTLVDGQMNQKAFPIKFLKH